MFFREIRHFLNQSLYPLLISILLISLSGSAFSQEKQKQLDQLRQNIATLQKKVDAFKQDESSTLEYLRTIEEEIDLTSRLTGELKKQETAKQAEIDRIASDLEKFENDLKRLKEIGARRAVFFYKHGRISDLSMLFSARSINQVLLWAEYQRRMVENDRQLLEGIQSKQERINRQKEKLVAELANHRRMLAEKVKHENTLKARRKKRRNILKSIRKDKAYYQTQLAEQKAAAERIAKLIALDVSSKTKSSIRTTRYDGSFAALKGRLPWPVIAGQIVSKYGKFRHPVLKTVTTNLGIDIATQAGASVHSVAAGEILTITWQRGYGNLVMISHADGYYTVYTHLGDLFVAPNERVVSGQAIGTVAENEGEEQSIIHFQIWQRTDNTRSQDLNPEAWLQRS